MSAKRFLASLFGTADQQDTQERRYTRFAHRPVAPAPRHVFLDVPDIDTPQEVVRQPVVTTLVISGSNEGGGDIPVSVLHRALPMRTATRNA